MQPSVSIQSRLGIPLILVVALHHALALNENLARDVMLILRVNLNLHHTLQNLTARTNLELGRVDRYRDKWSTLGHTVAHDNREVDRLQERLGLLVDWRTTDDKQLDIATERVEQLLTNLCTHNLIYQWHLDSNAQCTLLQERSHLLAINLLQHERYRSDNIWLNMLHSLNQHLRCRHLAEKVDMTSDSQRSKEIYRTTVSVSQWQERKGATTLCKVVRATICRLQSLDIGNISRKVIYGEHYALRVAGSSRGVVQQDELIVRHIGILNIIYGKALRIATAIVCCHTIHALCQHTATTLEQHMVVGEREYALNIRQSILVESLPIRVGEEQQTALRMIYDVGNIVRGEGLHNWHDNRTIGHCCDIYRTPTRGIATYEGNLIASFDTSFIEQYVELGYLLGKAIVRITFTRKIVGYGTHLTILAKRLLVHFYKVFL